MHLREWLNNNPRITTAVTVVVILLVGLWIALGNFGGSSASMPQEDRAWYTVDDGATYFADKLQRAPFKTADGKMAVRAHVYQCAGGVPFVNHLERFAGPPETGAPDASAEPPADQPPDYGPGSRNEMVRAVASSYGRIQVKKPGQGQWLPLNDPRSMKIRTPTCEDGGSPVPMLPDQQ